MADNNEQKLAGAADKAAEALKAAAQAAEQANEQKAEGCGCCGDACRCGDKAENEAAADAAKAEVDELAETAKKLEAANAKAAEHFDLYVRAVAEMENVRRRCAEDVQKAQKFSIEKAIEVSQDMEGPMKEGVQATYRQLVHALEVSGMKMIDPKNEKFDPNTQQAIAMVPAAEGLTAGHVAQVFQRGWLIHERVLRPAMVSVVQG